VRGANPWMTSGWPPRNALLMEASAMAANSGGRRFHKTLIFYTSVSKCAPSASLQGREGTPSPTNQLVCLLFDCVDKPGYLLLGDAMLGGNYIDHVRVLHATVRVGEDLGEFSRFYVMAGVQLLAGSSEQRRMQGFCQVPELKLSVRSIRSNSGSTTSRDPSCR
jgi:hypothetical protein